MRRSSLILSSLILAALALLRAHPARAEETPQDEPAPRYEVSINGENFTVPAGQLSELKSTEHPGTVYRVAVRLAQLQHWKLGSVQFDYQAGFEVSDNHQTTGRAATLRHPLGFVAVINDLGGPLPADAKTGALKLLVDALEKTLSTTAKGDLKVSKPQLRKLGRNAVEAVTISYLDASDTEHMSAVYLITGDKFSCSCLLHCLEENRQDAVDLVKTTLASLAPL